MTDPNDPLAALTPEQRDVVLRRLRAGNGAGKTPSAKTPGTTGSDGEDVPVIPAVTRGGALPCSFAQARLWLQNRLAPDSPFYHIHTAHWLSGHLDLNALESALRWLVERHESLRTVFEEVDGTLTQRILPSISAARDLALPVSDLSNLHTEAADQEILRLSDAAGRQSFDLERELPIRARLIRRGPTDHILLLTLHHIIADGWSLSVLLNELGEAYRTFRMGIAPDLPTPTIHYADYAVWQRQRVSGPRLDRQLAYWRQRLEGAPTLLALPTDRPRPMVPSHAGGAVRVVLDAPLRQRLKDLCRETGSTLFMVLHAAWLALLSRLSGQSDLVVAAPMANRVVPEIEELVGFFVNTVALRTDLSDDPSFRTLMERVRADSLEAHDNQDVPFEQVVEAVRPDRSGGHHPLAQVIFAYQNASRHHLSMEGLTVEQMESHVGATRFDLELHIWDHKGLQSGFLYYASDLFDAATAERLITLYTTLLENAAAAPDRPIGDLELLRPEEQALLLDTWGTNPQPWPADATLPALFLDRADAMPEATALEAGDIRLSYAALAARAQDLAAVLTAADANESHAPVAIALPRGPAAIIATLAALLAGRTYVPLDPAWPEDRLIWVVADSGATAVVVSVDDDHPAWGALTGPLVPVDHDGRPAADAPRSKTTGSALAGVGPESPAYIMYTSGSTGLPKGVVVPHRAVVRLVCSPDYITLDARQVVLHLAPATFDAATLEIWGPLLTGGRLVLAPPGPVSLAVLEDTVRRHGVTTLWLTAGLFHLVVDEAPGILAQVDQVLAGGDVLSPDHVRRALGIVGGGQGVLVNGYGPTENTTFTCCHPMPAGSRPAEGAVPLGRPVPNTTVRLVDARGRLVPVGVPGELLAGGAGLASGYLNRPELTAERFIADPLHPGETLYRTGDLARWRADGRLEFLGRQDTQVKVRGFRIELEEIESVLRGHGAVRDAVALVRGSGAEDKTLAAFVEMAPGAGSDLDAGASAEAVASHVETWRTLFDQTYAPGADPAESVTDPGSMVHEENDEADPRLNFAGWNSSYTGKPIQVEEMREWRDGTLALLRALSPRRVMEVGCGTGLLVTGLAADCLDYLATDTSEQALANVARLCEDDRTLGAVRLDRRAADDWSGIASGRFDTIIVNSVSQYFPDQAYLDRVIDGALDALAPGGFLFVGDVRSLALLRAYHASVRFARADDDEPAEAWEAAVEKALAEEEELAVDPAYFHAVARRRGDVAAVEVRPKRGHAVNELTRFRCDAILRKAGGTLPETVPVTWIDWPAETDDPAEVLDWLLERLGEDPGALGVRGIPNGRLRDEAVLLGWMDEGADGALSGTTVGDLRARLRAARQTSTRLEALVALAGRGKRALVPSWAEARTDGAFDAVFAPAGSLPPPVGAIVWPVADAGPPNRPLTNTPLQAQDGGRLVGRLRDHLAARLPAYMVPDRIIPVDRLPLTANGKPDRTALRALLDAGTEPAAPDGEGTAPRTATERAVAAIWSDVLGRAALTRDADFFTLGGHSLMATRITARLRETLGVDLPLAEFFAAPTVAEQATRLDSLGATSLTPGLTGDPVSGPVGTAPEDALVPDPGHWYDPFPLTDIQQAYWLGRQDRFELGNVASHVYLEMALADEDPARLEAAWNRLVRRHPMLRAVVDEDGRQRVLETVPDYAFPHTDLSDLSAPALDTALTDIRDTLSHRTVSGATWPLFAIQVSHLPGGHRRLHFSIDALIADAWSLSLLFDEWNALVTAPDTDLPPLAVTFRDVVVADLANRQGPTRTKALAYWRERAATLPPAPQLPLACAPRSLANPRFVPWFSHLEPTAWARLQRRARARGITPSVALMTAFADVLATWSATPAFTLNLTLFQRPGGHPDVARVVGDFTTLTLLEVDGDSHARFVDRARTLQARLWHDLDHRAVSGVEVMREIGRAQGNPTAARMPIVFTSTLPLEGAHDTTRLVPFGTLDHAITQTPQVWMDCGAREHGGALIFGWNAVADLFPDGVLDAMFAVFRERVALLADDDGTWTDPTPCLTPEAHRAVAAAANHTEAALPETTLPGLLRAQVARSPQAPAVIAPDRSLTYTTLLEEAEIAASALQASGVRAGDHVAICLPRGWQQALAVLATLLAGAAYVPVDPALPETRRHHLLTHAQTRRALTTASLAATLSWPEGVDPLDIATLTGAPEEASSWPETPESKDFTALAGLATATTVLGDSDPDALAYILYTSGSTGEPKGVMISHRQAVNTLLDVNHRFGMGVGDGVMGLSALGFDLSVYDMFGAWAGGGALITLPPEGTREPALWADLLDRHGGTVWNSVPAVMELLVEHVDASADPVPGALRLVLLSGDWIPTTLPERIRALWPRVTVVSLGGATEGSIWSITHPIGHVDPAWASIPYGLPLANQTMHVLGPDGAPRPLHVPGEIHIGGAGVALGYWDDPLRTRAAFFTHPHTGERLYRTGDLGRRLPDGSLEFLGRTDFQVKINGHRVEPGEIEATLESHPGIPRAAVTAVGPDKGSKRLVAHVALTDTVPGAPVDPAAVSADHAQAWWDSVLNAGRAAEEALPTDTLAAIADARHSLERLATLAMIRSLRALGLFTAAGERHTVPGIVASLALAERHTKLLAQWLSALSDDGLLTRDNEGFVCPRPLPQIPAEADLAAEAREAMTDALARWPEMAPALDYVVTALNAHLPLLRGETDPLALLFPEGRTAQADSLYRFNPASALQNGLAAAALQAFALARAPDPERPLRVLEVGAGTGGTTAALLPELALLPNGAALYHATDLSSFFEAHARDRFAQAYPFFDTGVLDITVDPRHQGYAEHGYDVVVAANVLHDAPHIGRALTHIRRLLAPGGLALVLEGTANSRLTRATVAFVEGFDAFEDDRLATGLPLLSAGAWEQALTDAGFPAATALPAEGGVDFGLHVIAARGPDHTCAFVPERLRGYLADRLPDHMVPAILVAWDSLPLTANGKVDRRRLIATAEALVEQPDRGGHHIAPASIAELTVYEAMAEILGHRAFGTADSFFAIGGDSLLAMRVLARIAEETGTRLPITSLMEDDSVAALAALLEAEREKQALAADLSRSDGDPSALDDSMEEGLL